MSRKFSKAQLETFRKILIQQRNKFAEEIRSIARGAATSPREASGDLSGYTMHMADMSADTYEREMAGSLADTEQEVLYQIDEALKRFDEGTYGLCEECEKPIGMSRLKVVPYTILCITCGREKEQQQGPKPK